MPNSPWGAASSSVTAPWSCSSSPVTTSTGPLRAGLGQALRRRPSAGVLRSDHRHRLNRGGHRQANAALYRAVIVRMQHHEPTRAYVARRTLQGKTKAEIIRCLKRLLARETWALLRPLRTAPRTASAAS
jgi:hypothetical protein